jgi:hypothetical protein
VVLTLCRLSLEVSKDATLKDKDSKISKSISCLVLYVLSSFFLYSNWLEFVSRLVHSNLVSQSLLYRRREAFCSVKPFLKQSIFMNKNGSVDKFTRFNDLAPKDIMPLKVPKHEIFDAELFTQSKPVCI